VGFWQRLGKPGAEVGRNIHHLGAEVKPQMKNAGVWTATSSSAPTTKRHIGGAPRSSRLRFCFYGSTANHIELSSMSPDLKPIGVFQRRRLIWDPGSATTSISRETTDPAKNSYEFEDLTYRDDIRILRVLAGNEGEPLRCMLFPSSLLSRVSQSKSERYKYKALSYWWGEGEPTHPITLYDETGIREGLENRTSTLLSSTFYVRSNLAAALRHFRREGEDVNFWVDAICIDQTNLREKTAQVSMMDEIYSEAESVCVWLGAGNPETGETFDFLRQILDLRVFD